ncbi:MAG: DNA polymerase III subunit delta [Candidatus Saccharibacteria bacterium]|nr:DNA polymerase III subunit delta [Candidatus Saccharibacteria bacterium]
MVRTFTGKNSFTLHASLKEIVSDFLKKSGDFAVEKIDASETDVDSLLQSVQSLPFLSPEKLVVISNIQSNNTLMDRLEDLIDRTAEGVEVILVEPSLDKRKAGYKILQKNTELRDFKEPNPQDLPVWAVEAAKKNGANISRSDANFLVERVGANQQLLINEIQKLSLYNPDIDRHSIELLTDQSLQSTIFTLVDAAFAKNPKKAIELYREQRIARIDPHYIIAMLTWQLQALAQAVFAEEKTESHLVSLGQSPYTARKSIALSKKISKADMKKMIVDLSELDAQIKTNTDPDSALELYLLNL